MGKTKIEWATHTLNFVAGCTEDGPECDNCYARTMSARLALMPDGPDRYTGVTQGGGADTKWTGAIKTDPEAMRQGFANLERRRKPARVFLGSMTDLFHAKVPRDLLFEMLDLIAKHDRHAWLLLTKRSRRMRRVITKWMQVRGRQHPPGNLWCGTTAGDQPGANRRIPDLVATPASVRFVSVEPMLGPVDLAYAAFNGADSFGTMPGIHWVIAGGESGSRARPMHPAWLRDLRDQCAGAGVAFHFKQWGEHAPGNQSPKLDAWVAYLDGKTPEWDFGMLEADRPYVFVERIGKKTAGRALDGRTHDDLPAAWPPATP